jgi:hypothetical protein
VKTLILRLPDSIVTEIENESKTRRISKSDVVRERLRRPLLLPQSIGSADEMIGDILEECWKAKVPVRPPPFHSPKKQRLAEIIRVKKLHR